MASTQGPRRLVLNHLKESQDRQLRKAQRTETATLNPGTINIHPSSIPILQHGATFHANVTQTVTWDGAPAPQVISTSQSFQVSPSSSFLDPSLVHSVYPPPGHADYWNVLPHILFNNLQLPWMMNALHPDDPNAALPWFGLLCFTLAELQLQPDELKQIATTSPATQGPNLAVTLTESEFAAATNQTAGSSQLPVNAIFMNPDLFLAAFADPRRFQYLTHVRTVNTTGMANMVGDENGTYSVAVSARPGPQLPTDPTVVYAHLVTLPSDAGARQKSLSKCGVKSLYSWQYTCLPASHFSLTQAFRTLGSSTQSLRNPDPLLARSIDPKDAWVKKRMLAGYSLGRYRPQTGETTMCLFRGPLIPNDPFDSSLSGRDLPSSDVGSDLAVVDREVGMLDISFQLAWSLGRTLAMADRGFSAAWFRLRTVVHNLALNAAKALYDKKNAQSTKTSPTFHPILQTLSTIGDSSNKVNDTSAPKPTASDGSQLVSRWPKSGTSAGTRAVCTFVNPDVKTTYTGCLPQACHHVACCCEDPSMLYNELNIPNSTDYALVLGWIMDKWFLHGIPMYNLIPDPEFLPKNTLRTFYVDPTWFKAFTDGALSIGDHYTSTDDARDVMKEKFTEFLNAPVGAGGTNPLIPRWGFLIRSELITKFPDLRISAPWKSDGSADDRLEVIRMERIDDDLLLVLFDRKPGPGDDLFQIKLQPPEHQLCFMLGGIDDWSTSDDGATQFKIEWKAATVDGVEHRPTPPASSTFKSTTDVLSLPFDFQRNLINSAQLATDAINALGDKSGKSPAALLGSQLIASFPQLVLQGGGDGGRLSRNPPVPNSLSTSRKRVPNPLNQGKSRLLLSSPPSVAAPPRASKSPLPTYGILKAQYPNLATLANGELQSPQNPQPWFYNDDTNDPDPFGTDNMYCPWVVDDASLYTPKLNVRVFNLHSAATGIDRYNTFTVVPLKLGILTDLNVLLYPRTTTLPKGWLLTAVEVSLPIGVTSAANYLNAQLLMPFPSSATANTNLSNTLGASLAQDFEHKADFTGIKIPTIRSTGLGNRWLYSATYNSSSPSGGPALVIRCVPNLGDPSLGTTTYDLTSNYALAFAVEDVQIGWVEPPPQRAFGRWLKRNKATIYTTEYYASAPGSNGAAVKIAAFSWTKTASLDAGKSFAPNIELPSH
ncbi:hypothetical protein MMC19_000663 [Ptychographa xylographoides]|nr:hypothetical protein [Ptychographa xylographoides]